MTLKILLYIIILITGLNVTAQHFLYQYDAAGNRVARVVGEASLPQRSPHMPEHGDEIMVVPSVTTDLVTIMTTLDPQQSTMSFTLSNLQGSVLINNDLPSQQTNVSLAQFERGIYLLTVHADELSKTFKIIKQ